ncbi:MAG: propionyl-CoA carboxylase [SAR324 cluster bacterium]|nr:propionyl-CoA carboxylase [SAR324 cluster bacterium]
MSWEEEVEQIQQRRKLALEQGGAQAVRKQHDRGRLTVRERIAALLDPQSFREQGPAAGSAELDGEGALASFTPANFLLGTGKINGRLCVVGGEDFTVRGGSPNLAGLRKSVYAEELACQLRMPLVRLHEGGGGSVAGAAGKDGGASPAEPVFAMPRFASVARALAMVPVASAALGPVAGLPASRLVASHFSVMTRESSQVLVAGPAVVARALKEDTSKEILGGAQVHGRNGVVDNVAEDEDDALRQIARFLSYLPQNVWELAPVTESGDESGRREEALLNLVPRERRQVYDMRALLGHVLDRESLFEMGRGFGPGLIVALARLNGQPVGVVANDCRYYAGAMTAAAAQKVRRFIEFCETFHLPIVNFVDEPGFMIGVEAEQAATIRYGTAAVLAAASCTLPWASVVVRKVFGVAGAAHFAPGAYVLAWPSAERGPLPIEGGVAVAFGREIAEADDPQARREELERQFAERQSPFPRAESFSVHDLIDPRETRPALCGWIELIQPRLSHLLGPRSFPYRP